MTHIRNTAIRVNEVLPVISALDKDGAPIYMTLSGDLARTGEKKKLVDNSCIVV